MSGDQAKENLESATSEPLEQKESVELLENLNDPTANIIITANGLKIHSNLNPNAVEFYPSYLKNKPETQAKEQIKNAIFKDIGNNGNYEEEYSYETLYENPEMEKQILMKTTYNLNENLYVNANESLNITENCINSATTAELEKQNVIKTTRKELEQLKSNKINNSELKPNGTPHNETETELSLTKPELENQNITKVALQEAEVIKPNIMDNSKTKSNENSNNKTGTNQDLSLINSEIEKRNIIKPFCKDANNVKSNAINNIKIKQNERNESKLKTCKEAEHLKSNVKVNYKMNTNEIAKNKAKTELKTPAASSTTTEVVKKNLIKAVEKLKSNIKVKSKINSNETTRKKLEPDLKTPLSNPSACKETENLKSNIKVNSKPNSNETNKTKTESDSRPSVINSTTAAARSLFSSTKKSNTSAMSCSKNVRGSKNTTSRANTDSHEPANLSTIKSVIHHSKLEAAKNKDTVSQKSFNMDKSSMPSNRSSIRSSSCNVKPNHKVSDQESLLKRQSAKTPRSTVASNSRKTDTQKVS